jgi:RND family efflux transporter MFP subunit
VTAVLLLGCRDPGSSPAELVGDMITPPAGSGPPLTSDHRDDQEHSVEMIGVLVPEAEVVLTATGFARLDRFDPQIGDHIDAGEVVAVLDIREDRSELASASAAWRTAASELERLEIELEQARATRADVETLEDFVSRAELDERRFAEDLAAARKRSAGAALSQQRVEVEAAQVRVAQAELRAPFDAVVAHRHVDPGATLHLGEPVVALISEARLIRFAVPEAHAAALTLGAKLRVTFADTDLVLTTEVSAIAPEIDAATRLLIAEAHLDSPPPLRVGTVARVHFTDR